MKTKAFQKIFTRISQITKATCSLHATGIGYEEMAMVDNRNAQVVKIQGDTVTLQVFSGTEGIPSNAEVVFLGKRDYYGDALLENKTHSPHLTCQFFVFKAMGNLRC